MNVALACIIAHIQDVWAKVGAELKIHDMLASNGSDDPNVHSHRLERMKSQSMGISDIEDD